MKGSLNRREETFQKVWLDASTGVKKWLFKGCERKPQQAWRDFSKGVNGCLNRREEVTFQKCECKPQQAWRSDFSKGVNGSLNRREEMTFQKVWMEAATGVKWLFKRCEWKPQQAWSDFSKGVNGSLNRCEVEFQKMWSEVWKVLTEVRPGPDPVTDSKNDAQARPGPVRIKNFKPVILKTGSFFWKFLKVIQISTEKALIWYITQHSPDDYYCGAWICWEKN